MVEHAASGAPKESFITDLNSEGFSIRRGDVNGFGNIVVVRNDNFNSSRRGREIKIHPIK